MAHRLQFAILPLLIFPALVVAEPQPTDKELYSPHWWLQKSLDEAAQVKTPAAQASVYTDLGIRAATAGDVAIAEKCAKMKNLKIPMQMLLIRNGVIFIKTYYQLDHN